MSVLSREQLSPLIPHSGLMCLLNGVTYWDMNGIDCFSNSHQHTNNPLLRNQQLSAIHLIEYAAQAAAIHHGLLQTQKNTMTQDRPGGVLAAVRDIVLGVETIEQIVEPLQIHAQKLFGEAQGLIYWFSVTIPDIQLASGQISIVTAQI